MRRMSAAWVAPVVAALVLCGCTGDDGAGSAAGPVRRPATWAWESSGVLPFSEVENVGGVALLYTKQAATGGRELRITALDPQTGKELWHSAASPAEVVRGISLTVSTVGDRVAYYRPTGSSDLETRLVVADPKTGKEFAMSEPRYFGSPPDECGDDPAAVCTSAWVEKSKRWVNYRFGKAGSRLVPDTVSAQGREIGESGLTDLGTRTPEKLGRVQNGRMAWSRPLADYFGAGASTDQGWIFALYPDDEVFVGSVGRTAWSGGTLTFAQGSTAGLSSTDGKPLWSEPGTFLSCAGSVYLSEPVTPDHAGDDPVRQPLRCRNTGTLIRGADGKPTPKGVTVALERFDVLTGKALWSTPLGSAPVLAGSGDGDVALVDDNHVVVDTGKERLVVDLTTGRTAPATAETQTWCRPDSTIEYKIPIYYDNKPEHTVNGDGLAFPCTADGKPVAARVDSVPSNVSAVFTGGTALFASPTAVVAYRTG